MNGIPFSLPPGTPTVTLKHAELAEAAILDMLLATRWNKRVGEVEAVELHTWQLDANGHETFLALFERTTAITSLSLSSQLPLHISSDCENPGLSVSEILLMPSLRHLRKLSVVSFRLGVDGAEALSKGILR